ncbi:MAG: hypothetical protein AAB019_08905, partial [Planctomycetota bacterium]
MKLNQVVFLLIILSASSSAWSETIEVIYRWQEPLSSVDSIVYQRLQKTAADTRWADYYYAMYARGKEDITISRTPNQFNQLWIPKQILLDKKEISYQEYLKLIEQGVTGQYALIYYQETPQGLLKLGEQPAGLKPYRPEVVFVQTVGSEIGKKSSKTLLYAGGVLLPAVAVILRSQKESEVPNVIPTAGFSVIPQTGTLSSNFYFDASSSNDPHE